MNMMTIGKRLLKVVTETQYYVSNMTSSEGFDCELYITYL